MIGFWATLRNGPNPGIGQFRGVVAFGGAFGSCGLLGLPAERRSGAGRGDQRLWVRARSLTRALQPRQGIEGAEEIPGDGSVVTEVGAPSLLRILHEADSYGVVRTEMFRAIFDKLSCESAFCGSGDVEYAGLDATGTESAPVGLGQAQDERFFGCAVRLEGFAKAAQDLFVFMLVFLGQDHERCGGQAMLEGVEAAALFAGFRAGSTFAAVAPIGRALSF